MSNTSTTYPHQDLIAKHKIITTELKPNTQSLISKFAAEKDEEKKGALDEKIFSDVEDYIEKKESDAKAAQKKERYTQAKTATAAAPGAEPKKEEPKKESSFMSRRFGRS